MTVIIGSEYYAITASAAAALPCWWIFLCVTMLTLSSIFDLIIFLNSSLLIAIWAVTIHLLELLTGLVCKLLLLLKHLLINIYIKLILLRILLHLSQLFIHHLLLLNQFLLLCILLILIPLNWLYLRHLILLLNWSLDLFLLRRIILVFVGLILVLGLSCHLPLRLTRWFKSCIVLLLSPH